MRSACRLLLLASCLTISSGLKMEANVFFRIVCGFLLGLMAPHPRRLYVFFEIVSQHPHSCHRARHNNVVSEISNSDSKFFPFGAANLKKRVKCTIRSLLSRLFSLLSSVWHFPSPNPPTLNRFWFSCDQIQWYRIVSVESQPIYVVWLQFSVPAKPLARTVYAS
jgi:hypothetical protein